MIKSIQQLKHRQRKSQIKVTKRSELKLQFRLMKILKIKFKIQSIN